MKNWFSALVRIVCLIEGTGAVDYMDCLHIFQSQNFDTAFKEALKIGEKHAEEYKNGHNERVKWAFKEIVSLDQLPQCLDGCEVYSQPTPLRPGENYDFNHSFYPGKSQPTQTLG